MSPEARRRALRAAAAVTAFSLAGCGPRKAPVQTSAPDVSDPAEPEVETPAVATAPQVPTEDEAKACADEVTAAVDSASADLAEGERLSLTDASTECCQTLDAFYSSNMERFSEWPTRGECCDLLDWQGGLACTPWGPPPPPAFRARKLA